MQTPGFPSEPPIDPDDWNKETLPAEPIIIEGEMFPADDPIGGTTMVFPNQSDEFPQITIVERNESERTKAHIDRLRDIILAEHPDWEHIAGGRRKGTDIDLPEYWIPGPGRAFKDADGNPGDGRPGGRFVDLTFKTPSGQLVHYQTVDVDRHDKPTQREIDAGEAIRRARYDRDRVDAIPKSERASDVFLFRKPKRR
jgi:hypothetical protein